MQIRKILLNEFKMGRKAAEIVHNINQTIWSGDFQRTYLSSKNISNWDKNFEDEKDQNYSSATENK